MLFLSSLASLVTVSLTGLLCVRSALFFDKISVTSRGLSFWSLSEDHIVNQCDITIPQKRARRVGLWGWPQPGKSKEPALGSDSWPGSWDRARVTWVRWGREERSAHPREGHAGPLTDAHHGCPPRPCLLWPHSLTPNWLPWDRQSCVPPRGWRSQTRPQPSVREPRAVSGLGSPARKEETQKSSPLLPPTAPFHCLGDFSVALGQQSCCATRLGPKRCEKQMCTRFRGWKMEVSARTRGQPGPVAAGGGVTLPLIRKAAQIPGPGPPEAEGRLQPCPVPHFPLH